MITVEHLTKRYGDITAVDDLSFQIGEGRVYGFLGPNGAGKSTTMNIMTGCLSPTKGRVLIDGHDILEEPQQAKRLIGYLPEQPPLYLSETPEEYLRFVGEAKGLKGQQLHEQIEEVIEQTGIGQMRHRCIAALSKGYRQRVGIAQALLGDPKVIILDEPTVGLDPLQIIGIRDLIRDLGKAHTVILSSHILSEVQAMCEQILIIGKGKLLAFGTAQELEQQLRVPGEIVLTTEASAQQARTILSSVQTVVEVQPVREEEGLATMRVQTDAQDIHEVSRAIFFAFAKAEKALLEMTLRHTDLEDIFIELTEGTTEEDAGAQVPEQTDESEVED